MKIAFITLTNNGYKELTENCIVSLKKLGINDLKVYCIDQECYSSLSSKYDNVFKMDLDEEDIESNLINFRIGNWSKVVYKKFDIIYKELLENDYVLFTDGDIVYRKKGFLEYALRNIGENDIIIQDDRINNKSINNVQVQNKIQMCSGFMLIKSNDKMKEIFNPKNIPKLNIECDQYYLNSIKDKFKYKILPMELFPNGSYFRLEKPVNHYMVHFNYIIGTRKKEKMKKYGYWLLDSLL